MSAAPEVLPADDEAALARLLGVGRDTVVTPAALSAGLRWVVATVRKAQGERPAANGQTWLRVSDVAARYGVGRSQAHAWLLKLRELGKVRIQNPIAGKSGKGDTFYYLPDIEAAFSENAAAR